MKALISHFIGSEDGQDLIEYGLLAAFISIISILTVKIIGLFVLVVYSWIGAALT